MLDNFTTIISPQLIKVSQIIISNLIIKLSHVLWTWNICNRKDIGPIWLCVVNLKAERLSKRRHLMNR